MLKKGASSSYTLLFSGSSGFILFIGLIIFFDIFDEIFWLEESEKKSDYIHDVKSIFIDDSFSQRKEVAEKCNIPTFDSSMIECLLDDRI